jgi:hypothetical protein
MSTETTAVDDEVKDSSSSSSSSDDNSTPKTTKTYLRFWRVSVGFVMLGSFLSKGFTPSSTMNAQTRMDKIVTVPRPMVVQQHGENGRLWVFVSSWDEGMSNWLISLSEILVVCHEINAMLVEPCVREGRLVGCGA